MARRLTFAATVALAAAVAVAFSDSSIVVLALPELYTHFHTTIVGVSWVITAYNLVVAIGALALIPFAGRVPRLEAGGGLALFLAASVGCGLAWNLPSLFTFRCIQGLGAALLLTGALPVLRSLTGSVHRGAAVWASAGAIGVAVGPALGGVLTQLFDWRAIFFVQAPVAGLGLAAVSHRQVAELPRKRLDRQRLFTADTGLLFLFGSVVGALFLSVLLVVTVWEFSPIEGAIGGSLLMAAGLLGLALLPASSAVYAVPALALCGAGFGLAVPPLTRTSVDEGDLGRSATLSVAARHVGLVIGLAAIAPLIASTVESAGAKATTSATAAVLDAHISVFKKVPIALGLRDEFDKAQAGQIPDLAKPFEDAGAGNDAAVRTARDELLTAVRAPLTRSFRPGFALSALFAALAIIPLLLLGRRLR